MKFPIKITQLMNIIDSFSPIGKLDLQKTYQIILIYSQHYLQLIDFLKLFKSSDNINLHSSTLILEIHILTSLKKTQSCSSNSESNIIQSQANDQPKEQISRHIESSKTIQVRKPSLPMLQKES
jgi:hypothetical protein